MDALPLQAGSGIAPYELLAERLLGACNETDARAVWACKFGRTVVVEAMLARHVDPSSVTLTR